MPNYIKHWANGGETKPSNLVSLCRFHHRAVHEGGFDVRILDDGAVRFVRPNGEPVSCERPADGKEARPWDGIPKTAGAWIYQGERLDLPMAVDLLIQCDRKMRDVPAGTCEVVERLPVMV
jgi:hypothetical protein